MANEKFTPGPWIIRGLYIEEKSGYNSGDWIAKISEFEDEYKEEECANANLVAAAPELYGALDWLYSQIGKPEISLFGIKKVQEALAKARGEIQE